MPREGGFGDAIGVQWQLVRYLLHMEGGNNGGESSYCPYPAMDYA